ncbi:PaaX family transcriptional regulator C-terminal domain-containing protein [Streptomyces sp. NPDC018045]|uniref:PaaX family transcriptional regulator n=1 Tax=Streptomyces sp. NPDC018045 TaxID=3365037 RepID=UPI0037BC1CC3
MSDQYAQGTPRSLIVTFYGAYGRGRKGDPGDPPGPVPVAALIRLLGELGVDPPSVRSAVSRLKRRGLLLPARTESGAAAYGLSDAAHQLLADGDRRIYGRPSPAPSDGWVLAVFSVPEQERHKRHLLRSRLARLGFGTAAPGVWIAPSHLYDETRHTLDRLHLSSYVDLFTGAHAGFEPTADAVARWWDLASLAGRHRAFLDAHEPVLHHWSGRRPVPPEAAYRAYLPALDAWRRLPYADPGLPAPLLPEDWPGGHAADVFGRLHTRLRAAGARFVRTVVDGPGRAAAGA